MRGMLVLSILTLLALSGRASADDPRAPRDPSAKQHLKEGLAFFKRGKVNTAIQLWEKGVTIEAAPWLLWNLVTAHEKRGDIRRAVYFAERLAASQRLTEAQRGQVTQYLSKLRTQLPPEVAKPKPENPQPAPAPKPQAQPPSPVPASPMPAPVRGQDVGGRFNDRVAWALTGIGLTAALTGAGFSLSASGLESEANKTEDSLERERLRDSADGRRTTALVLGLGGAAILVAGIVKFAIHKPKTGSRGSGLAIGLGASSIQLQGKF